MPRIRTIKPEAPQHRKVGPLSDRAFRVWTVLLTQADDDGRLVCDASQVRVWAFSYHRDVTDQDVEEAIQEIAKPGLIRLYFMNGTRYAVFPSWLDHQKINRPTPSKLPAPPSLLDALPHHSLNPQGAITEDSLRTHAGSDQGSRIGSDQGSEGIKEQEQEGKRSEGMQGEPREGKQDGALRSAPPSATASLRAPTSEAEPHREPMAALEGKNGNGKDPDEESILLLMENIRNGLVVEGRKYSESTIRLIQEAQRRLAAESNPTGQRHLMRCQGVTKNRSACGLRALPGTEYCGQHQDQAPGWTPFDHLSARQETQ